MVDIVIEEGLLLAIHALHDIPDLHLHVMQDLGHAAVLMIPLPQKEGSIRGNSQFQLCGFTGLFPEKTFVCGSN